MQKKKVTLLDLGGVVFQSTGFSNAKINWEVISQLNHKYGHELNIGRDLFPQFLLEYNDQTNQKLSGTEFLESVFDTLEINTELINHIRSFSPIIIVSDNYRENIQYISQRFNFDQWAIHQIYSFDYEMVKSDFAFFEQLKLDLSKFSTDQMLYIDDSQNKLDSASRVGVQGILFQNNAQIKEEIANYF